MRNFRIPSALLALSLAYPLLSTRVLSAQSSPPETSAKTNAYSSLKVAITLPKAQTNGVAIAPGGRIFMVIAKQKGQDVPQLAEYKSGQLVPYPDAGWNSWKPGNDASHAWVHANSVRFGPDGTLWVVDFGSPGLGQADVKHGPKLVGINTASGQVVETLYMDSQTRSDSALDDVRFNDDRAYLTDAGWASSWFTCLTEPCTAYSAIPIR